MKPRGPRAHACANCGADLRLDEQAVVRVVAERELTIRCRACGTDCPVPLGGVAPPTGESGKDAPVVRAVPPFRDLVGESEPPPFGRIPEPPDQAPRRPTLAERWDSLSPRRQSLVVAAGVLAVASAFAFWPNTIVAYPLRPQQPEPAAVYNVNPAADIRVPPVVTSPARPVVRCLVTVKPVPLNTLVTAANAAELFAVREVTAETAPAGAITSADDLHGLYARRDLAAGQTVFPGQFGDASVAPAPREWRPKQRVIRVITASGITEQVFQDGADGERQVSEKRTPAVPKGVNP